MNGYYLQYLYLLSRGHLQLSLYNALDSELTSSEAGFRCHENRLLLDFRLLAEGHLVLLLLGLGLRPGAGALSGSGPES